MWKMFATVSWYACKLLKTNVLISKYGPVCYAQVFHRLQKPVFIEVSPDWRPESSANRPSTG